MAYSPIGNKVVLQRLKVESSLVDAYNGYSKVIAKSHVNDVLAEGDIVITPYEYQSVPGEDDLIVAAVEDIFAKKV